MLGGGSSRNHLNEIFFQSMNRQSRVQRDQTAGIVPRDFDEPGIVDLLMTDGTTVNRRRVCRR